jgi:hypothetical protein
MACAGSPIVRAASYYDLGMRSYNEQNLMFIFGDSIGTVIDKKIKFFHFDQKWNEIKEMEFILPNRYNNVSAIRENPNILCIAVNSTVKFYSFDGKWIERKGAKFVIPKGYNNLFGFSFQPSPTESHPYSDLLCVVVDNKVKFYNPSNKWEEIVNMEFVIPNNSKSIFALDWCNIGVVIDNKVKIYHFDYKRIEESWFADEIPYETGDDTWKEWVEDEFILPDGYKNVFGGGSSLIVVFNKTAKFFYGINGRNELKQLEFVLK